MRNLNLVLTVCIVLFLVNNSYASISILPAQDGVYSLKAEDIKDLSLKEIQAKLGHKLGWKQKLAIQLVKHKLIKAEVLTEKPIPSGLSLVLGMILGWVLPLIGVAFAYLVFPKDKNLIKGAWIGSILFLVLSFIFLLAFFGSLNWVQNIEGNNSLVPITPHKTKNSRLKMKYALLTNNAFLVIATLISFVRYFPDYFIDFYN